jgi:hypothetical protein
MMAVSEVKRWIATLDTDAGVAIDDGGLTLCEIGRTGPTGAYLEVGGVPEDKEEILGCPNCGHEWPKQKAGLYQCWTSGRFFKHPEEGVIYDGKPYSWEGIESWKFGINPADKAAYGLCSELWARHEHTLRGALDKTIRPCPVSRVAEKLGLRLPLDKSVDHFAQWFRLNPWALSR